MAIPTLLIIQHLDNGGSERHFHDLASNLDRSVFEPHVIYFEGGEMSGRLERLGWMPVTNIPITRATDMKALAAAWQIRKYLIAHKIRLMVTFHFVADFLGVLASLGRRRPAIVASRRDMGFTRTDKQKLIGHWIDRRVSRYIAVSDAVRHAVSDRERIGLDKIQVIYNGTDFDALRGQKWDIPAERKKFGVADDDLVIGCIANFNPVKCHLMLIEAFAKLKAMAPGAKLKLWLAGDGPMREAMVELIAKLKLGDSVILPGRSQTVAKDYQVSDVVVLPSESEGFSNTIIEAMAFERPVMACAVGGNPEAIRDGETGLLVPAKDSDAMAAALLKLTQDEGLRKKLGAQGRADAMRRFSFQAMMDTTQKLLLDVAG
ncbi:MAG: glycosyltransferase [Candidatus Sumerlaeia bacterium]